MARLVCACTATLVPLTIGTGRHMPQPVARDAALPRFHVRELTRTVSSPTPSRLRPSPSVKSTSSQRITPAEQLSQISSESHSPSQLLQRSSESQSASRLHQRSHGRSGVYELQMPHQRADAPLPQVSVSVRPRFSDDPTPAKPPLFVQDLPVGDSALPSEMAEKLSLSRLSSAREAPFISPLRDADAVRACHDIVYSKITALEEAMAARDGRPESDLHEIAESYISKNKGPTKIRGGIETLRTACRCAATAYKPRAKLSRTAQIASVSDTRRVSGAWRTRSCSCLAVSCNGARPRSPHPTWERRPHRTRPRRRRRDDRRFGCSSSCCCRLTTHCILSHLRWVCPGRSAATPAHLVEEDASPAIPSSIPAHSVSRAPRLALSEPATEARPRLAARDAIRCRWQAAHPRRPPWMER